jgi:hypothetical protein
VQHFSFCCAVAPQHFCDDYTRNIPQSFQQLAEELLSCLLASPSLDQNIQFVTILIHRSPKIMEGSIDFEEHLIQVPAIAWPRRLAAQAICVGLAEPEAPFSNCLISKRDSAYGQQFFDVTEAEGKAEV